MLRVLLIRHGETDWNLKRRIMGKEPIGLNQTGLTQAEQMRSSLEQFPFDALYTSPILRSRQTAEILCAGRDFDPIDDVRLEEVNYGDWVGMTFMEARETPGYVPYYERLDQPVAPNGETMYQVRDRGMDFLTMLSKQAADQTVMVVSHADWVKCVVMHLLEIPFKNIWKFRVDNVSVSLLEYDERGWRVICVNQRGDFDRLFVSRFAF